MKKKTMKKLVLNRETLAELDGLGLQGVAGGVNTDYTCPSFTCQPDQCQYSNGRRTCFTCDNATCTTNYC